MQSPGVANGGDGHERGVSRPLQRLKDRNDLVLDLRNAQRFAAAGLGDRIVQVEDIDVVHAEAAQAAVHGVGYHTANGVKICRWYTDLCPDIDVGGLLSRQDPSEI